MLPKTLPGGALWGTPSTTKPPAPLRALQPALGASGHPRPELGALPAPPPAVLPPVPCCCGEVIFINTPPPARSQGGFHVTVPRPPAPAPRPPRPQELQLFPGPPPLLINNSGTAGDMSSPCHQPRRVAGERHLTGSGDLSPLRAARQGQGRTPGAPGAKPAPAPQRGGCRRPGVFALLARVPCHALRWFEHAGAERFCPSGLGMIRVRASPGEGREGHQAPRPGARE